MKKVKLVVGVEIIQEAIEDAKLNSELNGSYNYRKKNFLDFFFLIFYLLQNQIKRHKECRVSLRKS
jgi:hypothetical protein